MIVVDASVMVDLLMRAPDARALFQRLMKTGEPLHAPHLIDVEVAQVFRRFCSSGALKAERGLAGLRLLQEFPLARHPHTLLLPRIWQLRNNLTAYDAAYVALAEALDATLLTRDQKLRNSPGHGAAVEVI